MRSISERFWEKVNKTETCWLWTAFVLESGYGCFAPTTDTKARAHRVAWELTNGPILDGLCVLHKCDVRACVNPAHLFLGTRTDNARDRDLKGRLVKRRPPIGELNPKAKLDEESVLYIRERYAQGGISQESLGRQFGVTQVQISSVLRRESWANL